MNPLAFSTLACPDWTAEQVIERTAAFGYDAIEWRGGSTGHMRPELPDSRLAELRRLQEQAGVAALAVTAYSEFVAESAGARQASLATLRRQCDIAAQLGAPYVRAFLGRLPAGLEVADIYDRAAEGLETAAAYAHSVGVILALEPHDEFVRPDSVAPLLERVQQPGLGAIWDVGNSYSAGQALSESLDILWPRLSYVQVKDEQRRGGEWQLTALGDGEVPLAEAVRRLLAQGYAGAFSVEWEYAWHPELDPPEVALPASLASMRQWLAAAGTNL